VNAERALLDQIHDLVDPRAPGVVDFPCASRLESAPKHGENQRVKILLIFVVKGAIYKYPERGTANHRRPNRDASKSVFGVNLQKGLIKFAQAEAVGFSCGFDDNNSVIHGTKNAIPGFLVFRDQPRADFFAFGTLPRSPG
jgi:hypothetical protein